jgi:hypothetical protein
VPAEPTVGRRLRPWEQTQALQQRALLAVGRRQQGIGGTGLARRGPEEEGQPRGIVERERERGAGGRPEEVLRSTQGVGG